MVRANGRIRSCLRSPSRSRSKLAFVDTGEDEPDPEHGDSVVMCWTPPQEAVR